MSSFVIRRRNGALLRKASRAKIEEHFTGLPQTWRSTKWINRNNRYRLQCTLRFETDLKTAPSTLNAQHLIKYVSESAPNHVIDGWSCLGRAVEFGLRGDTYSSIHLGYYAELRAAMGLLAAEGVGIFSRRHAIIDERGVIRPFPFSAKPNKPALCGTHAVVWPILDHWAGLQGAVDFIDELIQPNMFSLSTWLTRLDVSVPLQAVARQWLSTWGIDLAAAESDHNLRNLASYRPSQFRKPLQADRNELIEFIEQLWRLFEPSPGRRFPNLERLLLRQVIRRSHPLRVAENKLQQLDMNSTEAQNWSAYLSNVNDPLPLRLVAKRTPIEEPKCFMRVIARAALLLFVATSASRRLLTNARFTAPDLAFWWMRHGEERCLWEAGTAPSDPLDIWQDILQSITASETWRATNTGGSLQHWRGSESREILGAFELVAIWGLVP
jgi:hypothetical protein